MREGLTEQYPYQIGPAPSINLKINSGLWILSKTPIEEVGVIQFAELMGFDKMSQKGALMVQTKEAPHCQVLVTHLQAGLDIERNHIRDSSLIPNKKSQLSQILVGDWNIYAESAFNPNALMTLLGNLLSHHQHILHTFPTDDYRKSENQWIFDYAFVFSNGISNL